MVSGNLRLVSLIYYHEYEGHKILQIITLTGVPFTLYPFQTLFPQKVRLTPSLTNQPDIFNLHRLF
jgi:hypothetical protein